MRISLRIIARPKTRTPRNSGARRAHPSVDHQGISEAVAAAGVAVDEHCEVRAATVARTDNDRRLSATKEPEGRIPGALLPFPPDLLGSQFGVQGTGVPDIRPIL